MNSKLSNDIKAEAINLGFFACGIAKAEPVDDPAASRLKSWLEKKEYAGMEYMTNYTDKRLDPRLLMKDVKSIVSVALNYTPSKSFPKDEFKLAAYALGLDYHDIVKNKLRQLAAKFGFEDELHSENEEARHCRIFVDSGPVLERYWAEKAGLGWTGKNHLLIIPHAGSMFFLGELFLDVELEYDTPMKNRCGNCRKCIEACPTHAINETIDDNGVHKESLFNTEKCLSYQLIENRGELSADARKNMETTIYGCDRCQQACPWNRYAIPNDTPELQPKPELMEMTKEKWENLSEEDYRRLFKGSAVKRAKYKGLMRNISAAEQEDKKE